MLGPPADYRPISKHDRANQQGGWCRYAKLREREWDGLVHV